MAERYRPNKDVKCFIVEPTARLEPDSKESLLRGCRALMRNVEFFHEPKGELLDLLVENCKVKDNVWTEITPRSDSKITQLSFNSNPHNPWDGVQEGLVDIRYVMGADCIEFRVGSTDYRVFTKPGPKAIPVIDSEKPTFYRISYEVRGNWYTHKEVTPSQQIKELDKALSTLEKHADLYYLIDSSQGANSCPYIGLSHGGFSGRNGGITCVEIEFLQPGHLEHILFKQQIPPDYKGTIVLGIHGGGEASFHIEKIHYGLKMKSPSYYVLRCSKQ